MLKKIAIAAVAMLLVTALAGFAFQRWSDADFTRSHPAPGMFAQVDGRRVHYRVTGEGEFTFVLEAGLGDYSGSWGNLESRLAEIGRVFVYDRAGLGWSEKSAQPRTVEQIAAELHATLTQARIPKPYVLVGHSYGGLIQAVYAMHYPEDAAALLLIDPSHPDQWNRLPSPPAPVLFLMTQISRMAPFGLSQLLRRSSDPVRNQTSYFQTSGAESRELVSLGRSGTKVPIHLGKTPIYVLTAGVVRFPNRSEAENKRLGEVWASLHEDIVASSSSAIRKHLVVAGASHQIHKSHLEVVLAAARELTERVHRETPPHSTAE